MGQVDLAHSIGGELSRLSLNGPACRWSLTPTITCPGTAGQAIRLVAPERAAPKNDLLPPCFVCLGCPVDTRKKKIFVGVTHLLSRSGPWSCQRLKDRDGAQLLEAIKKMLSVWSGSGLPAGGSDRSGSCDREPAKRLPVADLDWCGRQLKLVRITPTQPAIAPGPLKAFRAKGA